MKWLLAALAGLAIPSSAHSATGPYALTTRNKADIVRQVRDKLIDGESARWRWPLHQTEFGTYCGWVNAKNRLGAYTGWTPFMVIGGAGTDGKYTVISSDFGASDVVARMCAESGYDLISGPPPE